MSEEVGKALQSVVERLNQAAARRPKVSTTPARAAPSGPGAAVAAAAAVTLARDSEQEKSGLFLQPHDPQPPPTSYVRLNRTPQPLDSRRLVCSAALSSHDARREKNGCYSLAEF